MEVRLVQFSVANLGLTKGATTREIIGTFHDVDQQGNSAPFTGGIGSQHGLELCPSQVGPSLRLEYKDQPLHQWLYVAMKPIADSEGEPRIFALGHDADGLSLDAVLARPDDKWHPNDQFIFCERT